MQSKICTKCNQEKSIVEFSKFKHGKYGVKSACKYCDKQYRQDNAEHIAEYSKQYYQDKAIHLVAQQKQ